MSERTHAWNGKLLLLFHLLIFLMGWTLFSPHLSAGWKMLDVAFFQAINHTLDDRPLWQLFWALANHKLADWIEDFVILGFFIVYVKRAAKGHRLRRVAELLFLVLYVAAIIYCVNKTLFRDHLELQRLSPTLAVDNSVHLSQEISWMSIKDDSSKSFPGDHGTTALLFAAGFSQFARRRFALLAWLYGAFLCMPRLITGAHWLSDVIVGSGSITLFFLGWAFCTPFGEWCITQIEEVFVHAAAIKKKLSDLRDCL